MKMVSIVGARPQFIKAAIVSRALRLRASINEILVHTGQHYDENMSAVFFRELHIPQVDHNLGVGSGSHGLQTGRMLEAIERVLLAERPDCVLVYGDTNSTLAGALASVKLHVPVAHVEAGLRSYNRQMPEEINRVLADHASDVLFAPTERALLNLRHEGIDDRRIHLVGDVMYDAALFYATLAETRSALLTGLGLSPRQYVLATVHRAENTDNPKRLRSIFTGLSAIADELPVVVPLHPRTRAALEQELLLAEIAERVRFLDPLGYLDMVVLEKNARLIATDSGGVQKEAFFYKVPCVTMRDETEWVELVELAWNRVVAPSSPAAVTSALHLALEAVPAIWQSPYGDGHAADSIVDILLREIA